MRSHCRASIILVIAALVAPVAQAQIPDEFTNLKLLNPEISKADLVGTMRDWAGGLGVRCNYCHVGPDNLEGMDFATDEKAEKRTARKMLEMSRAINRDLLKALPTVEEESRAEAQMVSCYTCHRGLPRPPRNLLRVLAGAAREDSLAAAIGQYREMREEHFGAGQYDFRSRTLNHLAQELAQRGRADDAIDVLELNLEFHPEDAEVHATLGLVHHAKGDMEAAVASFRRALELDPENHLAAFGLSQLEKTAEE